MVNTLRGDPQTSEEEHFKLMLVQTEMERVKYLVRSYVRTRLHKVSPGPGPGPRVEPEVFCCTHSGLASQSVGHEIKKAYDG